ncbi:phosphopantothenoylcysteine decarboxylase-like [Branchiostoma floridae x Branchiostoma japonicum]
MMAASLKKKNVLIGVTGSVAAIKVPLIVQELQKSEGIVVEVQVVTTDRATHFFQPEELQVQVHRDQDEWTWQKREDPVLHIELRRWADIFVIAPLDANTLAKMAAGLCDNLLTCVVRCWDLTKPLLFCPAMNTHMWNHPLTQRHIDVLKGFGYIEVPCVEKTLACGDTGLGAMAEVSTIVAAVQKSLRDVDTLL